MTIYETIQDTLKSSTLIEGDAFKAELTEYLKIRRKTEKGQAAINKEDDEYARGIIGHKTAVVGATVSFAYGKNSTGTGRVVKTGENTFTVILLDSDGAEVQLDSGKPKKIWRYYHQINVTEIVEGADDTDSE